MTAPIRPEATSAERSTPSPKWPASAMPLLMTEMASAVESVEVGDLMRVLPSSVWPLRSSRKICTTRRTSCSAGGSAGSASARPSSPTRLTTICTSSASLDGTGSTTVLKRRLSALDSSFTPLSRLLAVAITEKPRVACTSVPSSGTGRVFSDSTVISESCTSAGMRVSSSTRAILPRRMACTSGLGTSAFSDGPWASSSA
ncbi:hypothetical protein D3C72_1250250 [compost metagenome]